MLLEPAQVLQIVVVGGVAGNLEPVLGRSPLPVFGMAIGKRQIAATLVTVSRNVQPVVLPKAAYRENPEGRIPDVVFVGVDEDEQI